MGTKMLFALFHGSYYPVKNPKLVVSKRTKDFGPAFYCTRDLIQAKQFSLKKARKTRKRYDFVSIFICNSLKGLNILEFDGFTDEWLDFIVKCRCGGTHDYDIVIGPVADDIVHDRVNDYIKGEISREQLMVKLSRFGDSSDQVAFCTEKAISLLYYEEVMVYDNYIK